MKIRKPARALNKINKDVYKALKQWSDALECPTHVLINHGLALFLSCLNAGIEGHDTKAGEQTLLSLEDGTLRLFKYRVDA